MKILLLLMTVLLLSQCLFAKEWNTIKPLQTKRAEVIKLLGNPLPRIKGDGHTGESFEFDGQSIYIRWTRADCNGDIIDRTPPAGADFVVYQITVVPSTPLTLSKVEKIDPKKEVPGMPGFYISGQVNCLGSGGKWSCSTMNNESGFGHTTGTDGSVVWLYYFPAKQESQIRNEQLPFCSTEKN